MTEGYPPFRGQVGHPEGLTLDSCRRLSRGIIGVCLACGERILTPDPEKHRAVWTRRLWLLFAEGKLTCAGCRQPFYGLKIDQHAERHRMGDVLAMWSRHDPQIKAHAEAMAPPPSPAPGRSPADQAAAAEGAPPPPRARR